MNGFKALLTKYTCSSLLQDCHQNAVKQKLLHVQWQKTIYRRCSTKRTINNSIEDKKEVDKEYNKLRDKNPAGLYAASGAVVRLPDSYFYMKVNERSRNFDSKPPGTHLESGAIKNKPPSTRLARLRALAVVLIFIYMGGQLSSLGARMLHDFEIFTIPDDDD